MPRKTPVDFAATQRKAETYAAEWLRNNAVTPQGVELSEDQFAQLMDTVLRGLMQAYAAGYMEDR